MSHASRLALAAASRCNPIKMSSCPLGLAGCPPPLHEGRSAANRDSRGRRLDILEDAPPHPPARPRTALPPGVGYLDTATGSVKQKNFCKLSSLDTHRFLKSGPHLPRTCIPVSPELAFHVAGVGGWYAEEGTPKFPGHPWVSGDAQSGCDAWRAQSGLPSRATLSSPSLRPRSKTP